MNKVVALPAAIITSSWMFYLCMIRNDCYYITLINLMFEIIR
jgi:hypothetical protein